MINLTPKKVLGTLFSLVVAAFLLTGLLVVVNLVQKSQEIKRGKAANENATLTLSPSTTTANVGDQFTVTVLVTPGNGAQITAVTSIITYASNLTLLSVTPGTFFSYPSGTEMLNLGVSCGDCRTTASGVSCTAGRCVNPTYPATVSGTLRFDLGAACDVTHMGCINSTCSVVKGSATDTCSTTCTGTDTGAVTAVCYPSTAGGTLATLKFRAASAGTATVAFDQTNSQAAGLDANSAAISTNIAAYTAASTATITVTGGTTSTLNSQLQIEGYGATTYHPDQTVRVQLRSGTAIATQSSTVVWNAAGYYAGTVSNITPGTYNVYVKGPTHLQKNFGSVTFTSGGTATGSWSATKLITGDMAGSQTANGPDNMVDSSDLGLLINEFAMGVTKTSVADLTGDSKVDSDDLILVINNFKMGVYGDGGVE